MTDEIQSDYLTTAMYMILILISCAILVWYLMYIYTTSDMTALNLTNDSQLFAPNSFRP